MTDKRLAQPRFGMSGRQAMDSGGSEHVAFDQPKNTELGRAWARSAFCGIAIENWLQMSR